jgi:alpha-L-rhamnosidase
MTTLNPTWAAAMVSPVDDFAGAPLLRRSFDLDSGHGDVVSALLHVSSMGVFEAFLNGVPVSDDVLSPGWSSYEWRLRYRTHDVTALLKDTSVLGASLGNGWFRGRLGWHGSQSVYGDRLGLIAQLEIDFADGHRQTVVTDEQWTAGPSDTLANDLYDGQTIDARRRDDSWLWADTAPDGFGPVDVVPFDRDRLTPYVGPPVTRQEVLRPVGVQTTPSGATVVDFGQNLVGWARTSVRGEAGHEIRLRHAEVLEAGELGVRPLRSALATDTFMLSGGQDVFEPTKTFHGFRFVEVTGWPEDGADLVDSIEAVVVHSDLRRTGHFECSHELLSQLHRNVVWGLRGNVVDLPTDCPQRDERLGWTGDLAVFAPSAAFLYDVDGFLRDWLLDLAVEQEAAGGKVPFVVPDLLKAEEHPPEMDLLDITAIWGDAAVWVPWALYEAYGDESVLATQLDSMLAHIRSIQAKLPPSGLWDTSFQFGDWLDPDADPEKPWAAKADMRVVATACLHRTARTVARAAGLVGRDDVATEMHALADTTRAAFVEHYVDGDDRILSDAPTVYALAIVFDLLDGPRRQAAGDRLAELVVQNGYRIATGFAGTPYVTDALTTTGHVDVAYRLLLETSCPSWLYPVTMGATTIWERWDSMLPDGSINPGGMTSFNHYALGAVVDWVHRTVGGLAPQTPGYGTVRVAPRPGGGLTWATTSLETRHGRVEVSWRLDAGELTVTTTLPEGVSGVLDLDGEPEVQLTPGTHVHTSHTKENA